MLAIAIAFNILIGYTSHRTDGSIYRSLLLPLIASIAFVLIADIDSPHRGLIGVHHPQNLESLASSLGAR